VKQGSRVLIAGLGFVGRALARQLEAAGYVPVGLRRSTAPESFEVIAADLSRPETLARLPGDFAAVVYCASADERSEAGYRRTYVSGLEHLLNAPKNKPSPPERLVFVSSTAVYAEQGGEWVTERSATEPRHFSGAVMLEAEAAAKRFWGHASSVRASGIYGPGRGRFLESVRRGEATFSEHEPVYTNRIHRDDLARAILHVLGLEAPAPLYLASDLDPASRRVVISWLAERLMVPLPAPDTGAAGKISRGGGNKRCDSSLLRKSGFEFSYPSYREGYDAMIRAPGGADH
jgi:nucleoside-diphosphate-sugar epimerase